MRDRIEYNRIVKGGNKRRGDKGVDGFRWRKKERRYT